MRIGLNSPQALLALLIRRRWWIIAPFIALTCMITVLAKSLPKSYVSESLILVQPRDVSTSFVPDLISSTVQDRVKNIETTVMSRTTLLAIVREFGDRIVELRNLNMDEKIEKVRSQIGIKYPMNPLKPGQALPITYFRISFQNQDPKLAQEIAQKMTLLFIAEDNKTRENNVDGTKDFLASELDKISDDLRVAEDKVKQIKYAHLGELPERLDMNQRTLESLSQNARSLDEAIFKNSNQKLMIQGMLAETPPTQPSKAALAAAGVPVTNNNNVAAKAPAEDQKILDYRSIKKAAEDIALKYPPKNPNVIQAKAILDKAASNLSAEELEIANKPPAAPVIAMIPTVPGGPAPSAVEPNPVYQKLQESLQLAEADEKNLRNQKEDTIKRIAEYNRRLENSPQVESDLADVTRERNSLQNRHDEIKGKLAQAQLASSLESQQKGGNFQIRDAANLPVDSVTPRKLIVIASGSAASLLFSLVLAVVVDIARQRIWSPSEIEAFWGVPVLVDIPEILTDTDLAVARKKKWKFAVSALGVAMAYSVCLYAIDVKHAFILQQLNPVLQKFIN